MFIFHAQIEMFLSLVEILVGRYKSTSSVLMMKTPMNRVKGSNKLPTCMMTAFMIYTEEVDMFYPMTVSTLKRNISIWI